MFRNTLKLVIPDFFIALGGQSYLVSGREEPTEISASAINENIALGEYPIGAFDTGRLVQTSVDDVTTKVSPVIDSSNQKRVYASDA